MQGVVSNMMAGLSPTPQHDYPRGGGGGIAELELDGDIRSGSSRRGPPPAANVDWVKGRWSRSVVLGESICVFCSCVSPFSPRVPRRPANEKCTCYIYILYHNPPLLRKCGVVRCGACTFWNPSLACRTANRHATYIVISDKKTLLHVVHIYIHEYSRVCPAYADAFATWQLLRRPKRTGFDRVARPGTSSCTALTSSLARSVLPASGEEVPRDAGLVHDGE